MDFVQLIIELEDELKIPIRDEAHHSFWKERTDAQVREFSTWLENEIRQQNPTYCGDTCTLVKRCLSEATAIDESEITPTSWFFRDLGMG